MAEFQVLDVWHHGDDDGIQVRLQTPLRDEITTYMDRSPGVTINTALEKAERMCARLNRQHDYIRNSLVWRTMGLQEKEQ